MIIKNFVRSWIECNVCKYICVGWRWYVIYNFLKENGIYIICKIEFWFIKYLIKKKISESLIY